MHYLWEHGMDMRNCERAGKKINSQQKLAIRLVKNKDIFSHSHKILNVYQLNILYFTTYMHSKVQSETSPRLSFSKSDKPQHKYSKEFCHA